LFGVACAHTGVVLRVALGIPNPGCTRLIEKFGEATGVPMVLNTSFNLKEEPIVTTPDNALNTFAKSGMDLPVLGKVLVSR